MDEREIYPYKLIETNTEEEESDILRNHPTIPFELVHGTPRPLTTERTINSYENGNKNAFVYDKAYIEDSHVDENPTNHRKFADNEITVPDYLKLLDKNFVVTLDRINRIRDGKFNQEDGDKYTDEIFLDNVNDYNIAVPNILPETIP